eukprot:jgi/Botrbrau1/17433/Bobra.0054s0025.1
MFQQGVLNRISCRSHIVSGGRSRNCGFLAPVCPRLAGPYFLPRTGCTFGEKQLINRLIALAVAAPSAVAVAKEGTTARNTQGRPTSAETARTITELVNHGTLATVCEDGMPLGTYIAYVLHDEDGQPILRLRADAIHTANLLRDSRCSLFVVPSQRPASLLARVTLMGKVEAVDEATASAAAAKHASLHADNVGVDAPADTDLFYRLCIDRCFFVGGLGSVGQAEIIPGEEYRAAVPDRVRECAARCVESFNQDRTLDVARIAGLAAGTSIDALLAAELLWIDSKGIYVWAASHSSDGQVFRVGFQREVDNERDVRSTITMLAQHAWEKERTYIPIMPPTPDPVSN